MSHPNAALAVIQLLPLNISIKPTALFSITATAFCLIIWFLSVLTFALH